MTEGTSSYRNHHAIGPVDPQSFPGQCSNVYADRLGWPHRCTLAESAPHQYCMFEQAADTPPWDGPIRVVLRPRLDTYDWWLHYNTYIGMGDDGLN